MAPPRHVTRGYSRRVRSQVNGLKRPDSVVEWIWFGCGRDLVKAVAASIFHFERWTGFRQHRVTIQESVDYYNRQYRAFESEVSKQLCHPYEHTYFVHTDETKLGTLFINLKYSLGIDEPSPQESQAIEGSFNPDTKRRPFIIRWSTGKNSMLYAPVHVGVINQNVIGRVASRMQRLSVA